MHNPKYAPHILLPQSVVRNLLRQNRLTQGKTIENSGENPICPRCEGVALRDIGYSENKMAQCPHCGYKGKMETTLASYIKSGAYR